MANPLKVPPPPAMITDESMLADNPFMQDYAGSAPVAEAESNPFMQDYQPEMLSVPSLTSDAPPPGLPTLEAGPKKAITKVKLKKTGKPANTMVPPPPPSDLPVFLQDALRGANAGAGQILKGMESLPGRAGEMGKGIVQQGRQRAAEEQKFAGDPQTQLWAAGLGAVHGPLQFGQDLYNATIGQLGHGTIQGKRFDAPVAHFADEFLQHPDVRPFTQQLPATLGTASAGASMAIPFGPLSQIKGTMKAAKIGAGLGAAQGYVGDAGQQLAQTGKVDQGAAMQGAALGAAIGAGVPLAGGVVGKIGGKLGSLKREASVSAEIVSPDAGLIDIEHLGIKATPEHALAIAQDVNTPPEASRQILDQLARIEDAAAAPEYVNPFKALPKEKGLAPTADGSGESVFLRTFKQELNAANDPGAVVAINKDATSWLSKSVAKKDAAPYELGLEAAKKQRLNEIQAAALQKQNDAMAAARANQPPAAPPPPPPTKPLNHNTGTEAAPKTPEQQAAHDVAEHERTNYLYAGRPTNEYDFSEFKGTSDVNYKSELAPHSTPRDAFDADIDMTLEKLDATEAQLVKTYDGLGTEQNAINQKTRITGIRRKIRDQRQAFLDEKMRREWRRSKGHPEDWAGGNADPDPERLAWYQEGQAKPEAQPEPIQQPAAEPIAQPEAPPNAMAHLGDDELDVTARTSPDEATAKAASDEQAARMNAMMPGSMDAQALWSDYQATRAKAQTQAPEPAQAQAPAPEPAKPVEKPFETYTEINGVRYTQHNTTPEKWQAFLKLREDYLRQKSYASMSGNAQDQGKYLKGLGMRFSAAKRKLFEGPDIVPAKVEPPMPAPEAPAPVAKTPPEIVPAEIAPPEAATPPDAPPAPRYIVEKVGPEHRVIDTETGDIVSRGKDRVKIEASAAKRNAGEITNNRGKRSDTVPGLKKKIKAEKPPAEPAQEVSGEDIPRPPQSEYQREVMDSGSTLPDDHPLLPGLQKVSEAKKVLDGITARVDRALETIGEKVGQKGKLVPGRKFAKEHETLLDAARKNKELAAEDFAVEVNSDRRAQADPAEFDGPVTQASLDQIKALIEQQKQAKAAYVTARAEAQPAFLAAADDPEFPGSVNVPTADGGQANVRLYPKSEKAKAIIKGKEVGPGEDTYQPPSATKVVEAVTNFLKDANATLDEASLAVVRALKADPGTTLASLPGLPQLAKALVGPARKSGSIADLVTDVKKLNPMLMLRRTMDIAQDVSPALHAKIWRNIALEAVRGREVKFKPEDQHWIRESLGMSADDIKLGLNGLGARFDKKQLLYLSGRRAARQASAKLVETELDRLKAAQGTKPRSAWDHEAETQYATLEQLKAGLSGQRQVMGTGELGLDVLHNALYDYVFKWNPAYHGLNLLDPLVVGSARAGLQNVVRGKWIQQTNKPVKDYVASIADNLEGPMNQYRKESREAYFEPMLPTDSTYRKGLKLAGRGLAKIHQLPDLPSVEWNNRDIIASALIQHGEEIGHAGGGVKFLEDLAGGKLKPEAEIDAMVHALQVNQDVNGVGSFGLDRDVIGRSGVWARAFQFISQPLRVTRMVSKWAGEGTQGAAKIAMFLAIQQQVAGRAALPKDARAAWEAVDPKTLYATEDFLDRWSIVKSSGLRDLTDKMEWAILPVLGGAQTNIGLGKIEEIATKVMAGKEDAAKDSLGLLIFSALIGGGGGTIAKGKSAANDIAAGKRKHYAFPSPILQITGQGHPLDTMTEKNYDLGKAISDRAFPGDRTEIGEFKKQARRKKNLMKIRKEKQ